MLEGSAEIDPVQYGVLWQKVQDIDKKMEKVEVQIDRLLDMASRSKGALWFGLSLWSCLTAIVGFLYGKH